MNVMTFFNSINCNSTIDDIKKSIKKCAYERVSLNFIDNLNFLQGYSCIIDDIKFNIPEEIHTMIMMKNRLKPRISIAIIEKDETSIIKTYDTKVKQCVRLYNYDKMFHVVFNDDGKINITIMHNTLSGIDMFGVNNPVYQIEIDSKSKSLGVIRNSSYTKLN